MDDIERNFWYRLFEILPGAASWFFLIAPPIIAFWFPKITAVFITVYIILWFLRSVKSSVWLLLSYLKSKKFEALDWTRLLAFFSDGPLPKPENKMEEETVSRIRFLRDLGLFKKWTDIYHAVIIPTYKEEKEILESSIEALSKVNFPLQRIFVVLATEERDRARALENAEYLTHKFGKTFGGFYHFMHPADLADEIPAKGANISYAGKMIARILSEKKMDFSNVIVTALDADNWPHPAYFANLTYHYLMEPERGKRSYQPFPFFHNNIWDVPFANRIISLANTFWYLSESGGSSHLFNAAAYAQSLDLLSKIDFWSRTTIVEDLHQFWRAYFYFRGNHEVIPLFVPVYQDALQNKTYFTSLVGQYKQLRRWAWGASEIPYAILKMWKLRKEMPFLRNFSKLGYLCYLQIMWATAPIIVILNKSITEIFNPKFGGSLFAYNLGEIMNVIFALLLFGILISLWISLLSLPRPKSRFGYLQIFSGLAQFLLLPVVTIIYGAIPAIDAQTRLMLNKPLGFAVTEKIRKIT